jgi:hypothetical protein
MRTPYGDVDTRMNGDESESAWVEALRARMLTIVDRYMAGSGGDSQSLPNDVWWYLDVDGWMQQLSRGRHKQAITITGNSLWHLLISCIYRSYCKIGLKYAYKGALVSYSIYLYYRSI